MKINEVGIRIFREAMSALWNPNRDIYTSDEIQREMWNVSVDYDDVPSATELLDLLCVLGCFRLERNALRIQPEGRHEYYYITFIEKLF